MTHYDALTTADPRVRTNFTSTPLFVDSSTDSTPSAAGLGEGRFSGFSGLLSPLPFRLRKYRHSLFTGPSAPLPAQNSELSNGFSLTENSRFLRRLGVGR